MNLLITGGAGFLGRRVAARLLADGHHVVLMDALHAQVHASFRREDVPVGAELLLGDVVSPSSWQAVLRLCRPDVVVHLASETGTAQSLTEATRHGSVNVVGTTQMLDGFTAIGFVPEHFVLASSRAIYGEGLWRAPSGKVFYPVPRSRLQLDAGCWEPTGPEGAGAQPLPQRADRVEPRPASVYAATKLAQEHILESWCRARGCKLSVLRFQNVYGPGQSLDNPYTGILALFSRLALAGDVIPVYEDGRIVRDFIHVEDATRALELAIMRPPCDARRIDVGSGVPTTVWLAARLIAAEAGAPSPQVTGQYRLGDVRAASCDPEPARVELGFEPQVALGDGLRGLVEWVAAEHGLAAGLARAAGAR